MSRITDRDDEMYYTVRAFVRFVFWGGIFSIVAFLAYTMGQSDSDSDYCDVTVHRDFTWTPNNITVADLSACRHPDTIVLNADGTWQWSDF